MLYFWDTNNKPFIVCKMRWPSTVTQGHRKCQPLTDRVGFFITDPKKYDTLILIRHKIEITLKITQGHWDGPRYNDLLVEHLHFSIFIYPPIVLSPRKGFSPGTYDVKFAVEKLLVLTLSGDDNRVMLWSLLSASLYFSKRGAYWDRLCRDVVGWLSRACTVAKRCILGL